MATRTCTCTHYLFTIKSYPLVHSYEGTQLHTYCSPTCTVRVPLPYLLAFRITSRQTISYLDQGRTESRAQYSKHQIIYFCSDTELSRHDVLNVPSRWLHQVHTRFARRFPENARCSQSKLLIQFWKCNREHGARVEGSHRPVCLRQQDSRVYERHCARSQMWFQQHRRANLQISRGTFRDCWHPWERGTQSRHEIVLGLANIPSSLCRRRVLWRVWHLHWCVAVRIKLTLSIFYRIRTACFNI